MRKLQSVALVPLLIAVGCGALATAGAQTIVRERGGTITVGEESWTIVPSVQCSVWSNGLVIIAGHAAGDPELEIVIEYGGPDQVRIGNDNDARDNGIWLAAPQTIEITIDGKRVHGTATFNFTSGRNGTGESRQGSFEVQC